MSLATGYWVEQGLILAFSTLLLFTQLVQLFAERYVSSIEQGSALSVTRYKYIFRRLGPVASCLLLVRGVDPRGVHAVYSQLTLEWLADNTTAVLICCCCAVAHCTVKIGFRNINQRAPRTLGVTFTALGVASVLFANVVYVTLRADSSVSIARVTGCWLLFLSAELAFLIIVFNRAAFQLQKSVMKFHHKLLDSSRAQQQRQAEIREQHRHKLQRERSFHDGSPSRSPHRKVVSSQSLVSASPPSSMLLGSSYPAEERVRHAGRNLRRFQGAASFVLTLVIGLQAYLGAHRVMHPDSFDGEIPEHNAPKFEFHAHFMFLYAQVLCLALILAYAWIPLNFRRDPDVFSSASEDYLESDEEQPAAFVPPESPLRGNFNQPPSAVAGVSSRSPPLYDDHRIRDRQPSRRLGYSTDEEDEDLADSLMSNEGGYLAGSMSDAGMGGLMGYESDVERFVMADSPRVFGRKQ